MTKQQINSNFDLRMTVYTALFTALIIIGGYISIPIGPVPIVLANFFFFFSGLFLGKKWGTASVVLFIFLGFIGLPVFAGGRAGLVVMLGPTGGFIIGYLPLAFFTGFISETDKPSCFKNLTALTAGCISLYSLGVPWLKITLNLSWKNALAVGVTPFMPGLVIKIILAMILSQKLLPRFKEKLKPIEQLQETGK